MDDLDETVRTFPVKGPITEKEFKRLYQLCDKVGELTGKSWGEVGFAAPSPGDQTKAVDRHLRVQADAEDAADILRKCFAERPELDRNDYSTAHVTASTGSFRRLVAHFQRAHGRQSGLMVVEAGLLAGAIQVNPNLPYLLKHNHEQGIVDDRLQRVTSDLVPGVFARVQDLRPFAHQEDDVLSNDPEFVEHAAGRLDQLMRAAFGVSADRSFPYADVVPNADPDLLTSELLRSALRIMRDNMLLPGHAQNDRGLWFLMNVKEVFPYVLSDPEYLRHIRIALDQAYTHIRDLEGRANLVKGLMDAPAVAR